MMISCIKRVFKPNSHNLTGCLKVFSLSLGLSISLSMSLTTSSATSNEEITVKRNITPKIDPLHSKTAMITGATSGIGKAIAYRFAEDGIGKLVLVGRRKELLLALKKDLIMMYPSLKIHTLDMSVTDIKRITSESFLIEDVPKDFEIDILVNNAGLALGLTKVFDNDINDAEVVMNTNVLSIITLCKVIIPGMIKRGRGHVVNIGSVAGHYSYLMGSTYNASKFAVTGFTDAARYDLVDTPIKITLISPGLCQNTEFSNVRLRDDEKAKLVYENIEALNPEDVADNVVYAVTRPKNVQIATMIVYANNQASPRDVARVGKNFGAKEV